MRHVDAIPDWAILFLAMLVVAGVYGIFKGIGVLVLGIIATAVWIGQIMASATGGQVADGRVAFREYSAPLPRNAAR